MDDAQWMLNVNVATTKIRRRYPWVDPEEIFSEALVAVSRAVAKYKPDRGAALASWIQTSVCWYLVDGLRTRGLLPNPQGNFRSVGATPLAENMDMSREAPRESGGWNDLVAGVGATSRRLLYLRYWEGLTLKEMGIRLGCHKETVRVKLQRVLRLLRKRYE